MTEKSDKYNWIVAASKSQKESQIELFEEKLSWFDARVKCREWGGDLASVTTEWDFGEINRKKRDNASYWIGAYR